MKLCIEFKLYCQLVRSSMHQLCKKKDIKDNIFITRYIYQYFWRYRNIFLLPYFIQ